MLTHESTEIRSAAIAALTKISPDAATAVPPLIRSLEDSDWAIRRDASLALGSFGSEARAAVPILFRMLDSEEDTDSARGALRAIDDADQEAVPILIEGLKSDDRRLRYYAVSLLRKVGPPAQDALPALRQILEDDDSGRMQDFVRRAIETIEGRGEDSDDDDS